MRFQGVTVSAAATALALGLLATSPAFAATRPLAAAPAPVPSPSSGDADIITTITITVTPMPTQVPARRDANDRSNVIVRATPTATPTDVPPTPSPMPTLVAPNQPTISQAQADPKVQKVVARPIRKLSQLGWLQGTWHVTGSANFPDGKLRKLKPTTYVFAPVMNGRWIFGADGRAIDYFYLTYDPFAHHWIAIRFASNPAYGIWRSENGWVGNRIEFATTFAYANGRQYSRKMTLIHKDARTFGVYDEEQLPDGSWTADDSYEFKKVE